MAEVAGYFEEFGVSATTLEARGLRRFAQARSLAVAETGSDGTEHRLTPAAAEAWQRLKRAAANDGVEVFIVSAFRSVERQAEIVRAKLAAGLSIEDILSVSALPGYSEHHTGLAIDLSTPGVPPLETQFEQTAAFGWLSAEATRFGFCLSYPPDNALGYQYEPWHWCFRDQSEFTEVS
jgi:D-alanyl-D-alanine carboxypeptidase